jgi:PadR family transcriptional regulator, regulatory protein AphA
MSLSHALLGLLAVEPASGYALTKSFEQTLGRWAWHAGHTSIYPELNRLAERGLVEVTSEGARGSRTYSVTPAGREEVRSWLLQPPAHSGKVRNEEVLRMFLLSALDPADALAVLTAIAQKTAAAAAELRSIRAAHEGISFVGPEGFGQLAAEFGLRQYEAVHDWALWAMAQLDAASGRQQMQDQSDGERSGEHDVHDGRGPDLRTGRDPAERHEREHADQTGDHGRHPPARHERRPDQRGTEQPEQ